MRLLHLALVASLAAFSGAASAAPLEKPIVTTVLRIDREANEACSKIRAGTPARPSILVMTDICHGWTLTPCSDKLLVRGVGVTEDQAQVLFTEDVRATDLVRLLDAALIRRWPGHQHLHLMFGDASCEGATLVVPFTGSHLKDTGPADGMRGAIRITNSSHQSVDLKDD